MKRLFCLEMQIIIEQMSDYAKNRAVVFSFD
jgi:hypothetical protein